MVSSMGSVQISGHQNRILGYEVRCFEEPRENFFLKMAAEAVRRVNRERDANGMSYARKAMIWCGLSLNGSVVWEESQLSVALQNIVKTQRKYFEGEEVPTLGTETAVDE
mmetsp:Transcript_7162/g.17545  ORF Transcript_7162/g.17545 Transcript_7162/m.17545 type:complete len:110 (-) Transcript_7162:31-360(-)